MALNYFHPSEFECGCGCGHGFDKMSHVMMDKLDSARADAGIPFKLNSAYRCINHNISVGGKPNSAHRTGHAVDIACNSSTDRYAIVLALLMNDFKRIGVAKTFIHADDEENLPQEVVWLY